MTHRSLRRLLNSWAWCVLAASGCPQNLLSEAAATTSRESIRTAFYLFAHAETLRRPSAGPAVPFAVFNPPVNCCQQVRLPAVRV